MNINHNENGSGYAQAFHAITTVATALSRSFRRGASLLLVLASSLLLIAAPVSGAVYIVNAGGDGGDPVPGDGVCDNGFGGCSLRAAIDEVNASGIGGDFISIQVPQVTLFFGELVITAPVTIVGGGPDVCTVRRNTAGGIVPEFRIFHIVSGGVSISGVTIRDGLDNLVGGIFNEALPSTTITSCVITDCSTALQGAFNVSDTTITSNTSSGARLTGESSLTNCIISENTSNGVYWIEPGDEVTFRVTGCTFSSNGRAGLEVYSNSPVIADACVFSGNAASGIIAFRPLANVTVTNSSITTNGYGTENSQGGIEGFGTMILRNCDISGNLGAGISAGSDLFSSTYNISNCTITNNTNPSDGGGLRNYGGNVILINSTISGNSAPNGGGILNGAAESSGPFTLMNCTITGNVSTGPTGVGGGIFCQGGAFNLSNSTVSGNIATSGGNGIWSDPGGAVVQVKNSIIADSVAGPFFSQGFNLVRNADGSSGFTQSTDQTGTGASPLDPRLDPSGLQNNGGPTLTIALLPDSPAIDKASSFGIIFNATIDQRGAGFPRTIDNPSIANAIGGDSTDVGAFEAAIPSSTPTPTPTPSPTPSPTPTATPTPTPTATPTPTPIPTPTPTATPTPTPPAAPKAEKATNETGTSFTVNWKDSPDATGYRLDVSTSSSFGTFVSGFQDLDVGNVTNRTVTGLTPKTSYFFRVRAYNTGGTSANSNVITTKTKNH